MNKQTASCQSIQSGLGIIEHGDNGCR